MTKQKRKEGKSMKKAKKEIPNTILIILIIIVAACVLTWVIPAGKYVRVENAAGVKVIDPSQFAYVDRTPVSLLNIPNHIVSGFKSGIALFLCIAFSGGAFRFVNLSGALQSMIAKVVKKYSDKIWVFIPLLTMIFTIVCTAKGVNTFIPFAPILVMIAQAMGLDAIVGVGIILLGGAVGFSTGTINTTTTAVAQELAGLPLFSGLSYRAFSLVVFAIVTNIYLVRYALKIKKNPESSYMYGYEAGNGEKYDEKSLDSFGPMDKKKWMILITLIGTLGVLVGGSLKFGWGMEEMAAGYIWMAAIMAIILRMSPNQAVDEFFKGMKMMLVAASIVCVAKAVSSVLSAGTIIDTIIYGLSHILNVVPTILQGPAMYIINIIVNIFITSGSGQAAVIIPIVAPLADMIGLTRQAAVLAFNFGDGFCNYILPTSSALMGILSMGNVPYDRWMKFMWKLFLIWVLVGSILMVGAQVIHLGPM